MPRAILAALLITFICAVPSSARVGNGKIAFFANDGLYTINPDGTGRTLLKSEDHLLSVRWSPDGSRLAFVDRHGTEDRRLMVMNADGSNEHLVVGAASIALSRQPWSPDGSRIAWGPVLHSAGDVYTANASGGDVRRLTFTGGIVSPPSWSPTGSTLVYSTRAGVFVIGADGSGQRQIAPPETPPGYFPHDPTWSPTGEWIAFMGAGGLTAVRPDGNDLHTVTPWPPVSAGSSGGPTWSPDGSKIAFGVLKTDGRAGIWTEVYVVDADGSHLKRLSPPRVRDSSASPPIWSPDGRRVLYHSNHSGMFTLLTVNADGKCELHVASGELFGSPSWQPIPNGPPTGDARCHAISVTGTVSGETPTAVVIGATVVNEGTEPLTKVTLEVSARDAVSPAPASRGCTVRSGRVTCRFRRLEPGHSHRFSVRLEARRVRPTGQIVKLAARIRADASEKLLPSSRAETSVTVANNRCTERDRGEGTIRGTSSADRICGRRGADRIYPGPGSDVVRAGGGNDAIFAVDGRRHRDQISCGPGRDRVSADRRDRIARDCERVSRP